MLKDKLKLPASNKPGKIFPDRLGSLVMVAGLHEKRNDIERSEFELEPGEELEAIKPGAFGFHRESDGGGEALDEEKDENDQRIRQKLSKDAASTSVVLKSISLDEKRSDLEYELSRREINLEKLRRIASTGIPDGGGLRAMAWKKSKKASKYVDLCPLCKSIKCFDSGHVFTQAADFPDMISITSYSWATYLHLMTYGKLN